MLLTNWLQIGGCHDPVLGLQMPVSSPGFYLFFWPTGSKSDLPMTPSLGSVNLLEWLTELPEIHLLTRLPLYYKRM